MATVKLYPPYIEGKLVAQTGDELAIPFEMNKAVGTKDFDGIQAQIKTVTTGQIVGVINSNRIVNNIAYFKLEQSLQIGQFYKIQLAYMKQDVIGYKSTVGIFKYSALPTIWLEGLSDSKVNPDYHVYQGVFLCEEDPTEKEYSYSYELYNNTELVYSSGELIHNSSEDVDKFILPINLQLGVQYDLVYSIKTINGLTLSKTYYIINDVLSEIPVSIKGQLIASLNYDNGYISIDLIANDEESAKLGGQYRLLRFSNDSYEIIDTFIIQSAISTEKSAPTHIYNDFTIQQGVEYKYAIQQYSDLVFSKKLYSNTIFADFEDMFLYDGQRQLKLRFNPKVSQFKTTLLESKLNTLGGKYPTFFRNGNTAYKEFSISALISMLSDNNECFYEWKTDGERDERGSSFNTIENDFIKQTDLVSFNLRREREFKLEALNWLNNGQPKLFRSPAEGNYIVRLMNVSLTPEDTLGRMLHTFNCQAYEVIDNTFNNLLEHQLISGVKDIKTIVIQQAELTEDNLELSGDSFETLHLMLFGDYAGQKAELTFKDGSVQTIVIGNTLVYDAPVQNENPVIRVRAVELEKDCILRVQYDASSLLKYPLLFEGESITSFTTANRALQIIGPNSNIIGTVSRMADNYNIASLTLSAKMPADISGIYSDVTLQSDPAGYLYTKTGGVIGNADYDVIITFEDGTTSTINLGSNTLFLDIQQEYPNKWKMDSFGNITLTCDAFEDNHFKPVSISIGAAVYANMYVSYCNYN